jgi:predicted acetyltransferase
MDIQIRPIEPDEFVAFSKATETAFGEHPDDDSIERWRSVAETDRTLAAFDGPDIVGTTALFTLGVTVPGGGELPMAGVSAVGVLPTHRRRGILTALMSRQLEDVRERGEPLAGLYASEGAIYGRYGYGLAMLSGRIDADRDHAVFVNQVDDMGSVRLVDHDEAVREMRPVYERARAARPGMMTKPDAWWTLEYSDPERWRDGASALFYVLHEVAGAADGYATYRVKSDWSQGLPGSSAIVRDLVAENPTAYAALWRFAFGLDLMKTVVAEGRPADEPLLHMVDEPARLRFRLTDGLYLRVVDVAAALEGRRYRTEGSVVLDVRDGFCPWNEGRYVLDGAPDGATCRSIDREPDLTLSATDLAAAYLGGTGLRTLASAGRVTEERRGAVDAAAAMFGADEAPWCMLHF